MCRGLEAHLRVSVRERSHTCIRARGKSELEQVKRGMLCYNNKAGILVGSVLTLEFRVGIYCSKHALRMNYQFHPLQ